MARWSRSLLWTRLAKAGFLAILIVMTVIHTVTKPFSVQDLPVHGDILTRKQGPEGPAVVDDGYSGGPGGPGRKGHRGVEGRRPEAPMRQLHAEPLGPVAVPDVKDTDQRPVRDSVYLHPPLLPRSAEHPLKIIAQEKRAYLPCAWVSYTANGHFIHHVVIALRKLGYHIHYRNETFVDCDVIWTYDYPFWSKCWNPELVRHVTENLGRHQKVNHFPGIGYIADKANLASSGLHFTPPAFLLPEDAHAFLETARKHPTWQWVQKNRGHRGVKITRPQDVDLRKKGTFMQYFMDTPLLIDGRKFDFSVYVVLTSVSPLRVYVYGGDWAVRFCRKPYEPFDPSDTDRYVLYGADHIPIWEMPSLTHLWNPGFGFKKSLFMYLKEKGHDVVKLEESVDDIVQRVFEAKEKDFISAVKVDFFAYNDTRNLFELVRFDFILDTEMRVYLMEVNMSPDLSTEPGNPRGELYQNIIYGVLSMESIVTVLKDNSGKRVLGDIGLMVSKRDLRVYMEDCLSNECRSCTKEVCQLCPDCLTSELETQLQTAYFEHTNKQGFRRLLPRPFENKTQARMWTLEGDPAVQAMTPANRLLFIWFRGKCLQDAAWCL